MTSNTTTKSVAALETTNNGNNISTMSEESSQTAVEAQPKVLHDAPPGSSGDTAVGKSDIHRSGEKNQPSGIPHSVGFYMLVAGLCFAGLATALEATITSTALPTIIDVLGGADLYIWVVNGYYLTMTAFQPLFGQVANIYGRRWPMIFATATFTLGSGICGGAKNITMLIAGRIIQGIGAGGINVLIEIIVCDLVPLRQRGKFLGAMFGCIGMGTVLGPLFGGLIVQHSSWRWVFYLNLPVGGLALVALFAFLKVKSDTTTTHSERLRRVDWLGNTIFVLSMISVLIALSWAGAKYPWSSYHVIVPLVMFVIGAVLFGFYETSRFCENPTMPPHLFSNRTSAVAFILTFLHSLSGVSVIYFLPVYFQGVLSDSPGRSGTDLLPTILFILPFAIIGGTLLSKFGRYRPIQHVGFALMIVGFGLLSLFRSHATTAQWVGYQLVSAAGTGLILPVLLPAVQAPLTEADTALSTATWAFIRTFGLIWGATIPTAAFNNRFQQLLYRITDPVVAAELSQGGAYEHATKAYMETITDQVTKAQVISVFVDSLKLAWYVSIAFAGLGFLLVIFEKEIPLRKELETEFGMEEEKKSTDADQPTAEKGPA